jgi:acetyl-CoA acetyltransferase
MVVPRNKHNRKGEIDMRDVVIASYVRSAQSRCRPNDPGRDWLFKMRTDDLVGKLLPEALERAKTKPEEVDDHIIGCAQAVGENFTMGGRGPFLLANLDKRTACKQVDECCAAAWSTWAGSRWAARARSSSTCACSRIQASPTGTSSPP